MEKIYLYIFIYSYTNNKFNFPYMHFYKINKLILIIKLTSLNTEFILNNLNINLNHPNTTTLDVKNISILKFSIFYFNS